MFVSSFCVNSSKCVPAKNPKDRKSAQCVHRNDMVRSRGKGTQAAFLPWRAIVQWIGCSVHILHATSNRAIDEPEHHLLRSAGDRLGARATHPIDCHRRYIDRQSPVMAACRAGFVLLPA